MPSEKVPAFVCVYSPSGYGKTTDMGYSFPNALFIAAPGALKPLEGVCGYTPKEVQAATMDDATAIIRQVSADKSLAFDALVVDDFSFMAEQTMAVYEKRYSGFKLFGALRESAIQFRNAARYAGIHVAVNCWQKAPKLRDDGIRQRGGPDLTGKLPEQLPAMADLVLRGGRDPRRSPWAGIYHVDGGNDYVGKDRDGGTPEPAPMNLGEILRLNGYTLSRHPDLPWQEPLVEEIAQTLLRHDPDGALNDAARGLVEEAYTALVGKGLHPLHVRWTMRDALDRADLRRSQVIRHASFFGPAPKGGILGL